MAFYFTMTVQRNMTLTKRSEGRGKEGMQDILRFSWNKVYSLITFRIKFTLYHV